MPRALGATPIFSNLAAVRRAGVRGRVRSLRDDSEDAWSRGPQSRGWRRILALGFRRQARPRIANKHFDGSANLRLLEGVLRTHEAPTAIARAARVLPMAAGLAWGLDSGSCGEPNR